MENLRIQKDAEIKHLINEAEKNRDIYETKINKLDIELK